MIGAIDVSPQVLYSIFLSTLQKWSSHGEDCKTCSLQDLFAHWRSTSWSKCEGIPSPGYTHQAMVAAGCMNILKRTVRELRSCWTWWQHLLYSQDHSLVSEVCGGDKSSVLQLSAPEVNHPNGVDSPSREQRALTLTKMQSIQNVLCCPTGYKWYLPLGVWVFFSPHKLIHTLWVFGTQLPYGTQLPCSV